MVDLRCISHYDTPLLPLHPGGPYQCREGNAKMNKECAIWSARPEVLQCCSIKNHPQTNTSYLFSRRLVSRRIKEAWWFFNVEPFNQISSFTCNYSTPTNEEEESIWQRLTIYMKNTLRSFNLSISSSCSETWAFFHFEMCECPLKKFRGHVNR